MAESSKWPSHGDGLACGLDHWQSPRAHLSLRSWIGRDETCRTDLIGHPMSVILIGMAFGRMYDLPCLTMLHKVLLPCHFVVTYDR